MKKNESADKGTFLREDFFFTTRFFKVAGILDRGFLATDFIKAPCNEFKIAHIQTSFIIISPGMKCPRNTQKINVSRDTTECGDVVFLH